MFEYKFNFEKKIKKKNRLYSSCLWIAHLILNYIIFSGVEIHGKENLPVKDGVMIVPNHITGWDPFCVALSIFPKQMYFMAKSEFFEKIHIRIPLVAFNGFPVNRGTADLSSINFSKRVLREDNNLCIFSQGTRDKTNQRPKDFKAGAALIARGTKCDVLPIALYKDYRGKRGQKLRPKMVVRIGELIEYDDLGLSKNAKSVELKIATEIITERIGELWDKNVK